MALGMALLAGAGLAKLGGNLIGARGREKRAKRLRAQLLATLRPQEAQLATMQFGQSQTDSDLSQGATANVLNDYAQRGILGSSYTAPAVAQAIAPIQERANARRQGLMERLAAAKQAIYANTDVPGTADAFGQTLGEFGGLLSLGAGYHMRGGGGEGTEFGDWLRKESDGEVDEFDIMNSIR